jgi:hypothetical protein
VEVITSGQLNIRLVYKNIASSAYERIRKSDASLNSLPRKPFASSVRNDFHFQNTRCPFSAETFGL